MCAYDRAGRGWSDLGPTPRSAARIVDELHILLETAGVSGPYILTGALRGVVSMCGSTRTPTQTMSPEWCWLMPRMKTKVDSCPLLLVPGQSIRSSCTFGRCLRWLVSLVSRESGLPADQGSASVASPSSGCTSPAASIVRSCSPLVGKSPAPCASSKRSFVEISRYSSVVMLFFLAF